MGAQAPLAIDTAAWAADADRWWRAMGGAAGEGRTPAAPLGHEHEYGGVHRLTWAIGLALGNASRALEWLAHTRGARPAPARLSLAAAARFLFPERNFGLRLAGRPLALGGRAALPLLDAIWPARDGGWFVPSSLHPSGAERWATALGCGADADALRAAVAAETGPFLEQLALRHGLAGAHCRRPEAWRRSPQGRHLAAQPLVLEAAAADRAVPGLAGASAAELRRAPLTGARVVCLGQVFAGPVAARLLAEQGAEVLYVSAPGAAPERAVWLEGHAGGRAAALDLRSGAGRAQLARLVARAHVCIDNLRPGALEALGVWRAEGGQPLPHRVCISAFGPGGPMAGAAGYDMTVQAATGVMASEGGEGRPAFVPSLLVADFLAAALAATAAIRAVARGLHDGRPRHAEVGLARSLMALQDLGRRPPREPPWCGLPAMRTVRTPWGRLRRAAAVPAWCAEAGDGAGRAPAPSGDVPAQASSVATWREPRAALPELAPPC